MKKMVEFLTHLRELFGIRLGKVTLFFGIFAKVKEVFRFPIPDQFELMINQGALVPDGDRDWSAVGHLRTHENWGNALPVNGCQQRVIRKIKEIHYGGCDVEGGAGGPNHGLLDDARPFDQAWNTQSTFPKVFLSPA